MEKTEFDFEKIKENFVPLITLAVIFTLTVTLSRSILTNYLKTKANNKTLEEKFSALQRKNQLLQSLDRQEIETRANKLEEVFPSEKPVILLISALNQISEEVGVSFGGVSIDVGIIEALNPAADQAAEQGEAVISQLQSFGLDFRISGSIPKIVAFINRLEKAAPLMQIESFNLSLNTFDCNLTIKVYYQNFPKTLGALDQPVPLLTDEEKKVLYAIAGYQKIEPIIMEIPLGKENLFSLPSEEFLLLEE